MISNASGARSTNKAGPARQRGVTLSGMIMVCIGIALLLLLTFKVAPVYLEYMSIQRHLRDMAEDPSLKGARRADVARAWSARSTVDNITSLRGEDISVERQGDASVLSAEYSVKVPLFGNVSLWFDFHPTSRR